MMKLLFDCIPSTQPEKCSSASKFKKLALRVLAEHPDAFIYWLIPEWTNESSMEWLPKSDRITYIKFPYLKDRVREYQLFFKELEDVVSFFGSRWDYDILVTMRTAQIPNFRVSMNSARLYKQTWLKKVICLEEMAILEFRQTVPVSNPAVQDAQTIAGYLAADVSYITAIHVRNGILNAAKAIYTPSKVNELRAKLRLVNPSVVEDFSDKKPEHRFQRGQQPFCLGFVGRMSNSTTRLPDVYDVMDKNWILKGDKGFKVIISTVSTGVKLPPPDFVVFENNPREKFWARVKEDMHLVISLSIDAEFSMSLIEPIMFGTPVVLAHEDWTEGLVGPEYPFFVKGVSKAYGMVKAFHDDYAGMYARFLDWREKHFRPRFLPGGVYGTNLYDDLMAEIGSFPRERNDRFRAAHPGKANNELTNQILEHVAGQDEFRLFDTLADMAKAGKIESVTKKLNPDLVNQTNLTFMTPWHEMKVIFETFHGYGDASAEVGHFRKVKP